MRCSEDDLDTRQYMHKKNERVRYSCVHPYTYVSSSVLTSVEAPYAHDYLAQ